MPEVVDLDRLLLHHLRAGGLQRMAGGELVLDQGGEEAEGEEEDGDGRDQADPLERSPADQAGEEVAAGGEGDEDVGKAEGTGEAERRRREGEEGPGDSGEFLQRPHAAVEPPDQEEEGGEVVDRLDRGVPDLGDEDEEEGGRGEGDQRAARPLGERRPGEEVEDEEEEGQDEDVEEVDRVGSENPERSGEEEGVADSVLAEHPPVAELVVPVEDHVAPPVPVRLEPAVDGIVAVEPAPGEVLGEVDHPVGVGADTGVVGEGPDDEDGGEEKGEILDGEGPVGLETGEGNPETAHIRSWALTRRIHEDRSIFMNPARDCSLATSFPNGRRRHWHLSLIAVRARDPGAGRATVCELCSPPKDPAKP